jgi:succinate dehydrogenase hydrophobic anchor subunit
MIFRFASAGPALLPAVGLLVHRRPGSAFRLFVRNTAVLVAFLDVFGLALFLARVTEFVSARHWLLPT